MPYQRQSLTETLIAYTRDAAYAEFQEQQKGQIRKGYLADLVMVPKNLFEIPSTDIADLKPSLTMVDGNVVLRLKWINRICAACLPSSQAAVPK